jgi:L-ascorbate metabolism protein UlaG (beta-lactamase superfamily)
MSELTIKITYIGGPTALLEMGGLRLLTDPTFDPAGSAYPSGSHALHKTAAAARTPETLGPIDAVLLSHDHHDDNLDHAGREFLPRAGSVLTTVEGAARLGGRATGLAHWQSVDLPARQGGILRVTGTPCRHGPAGGDRGPVTGFVLALTDYPEKAVYVSGDTVWYEGVAEVIKRFPIKLAILNMGAARVPEVGPDALTFTAEDGVQLASALPDVPIVPLHFEGWEHFSEDREHIEKIFKAAGVVERLHWPEAGKETRIIL